MKGPIEAVEVSYFVHATEDAETISDAISTLLSVKDRPEEVVMEGHFGNTITWVRHHLSGKDASIAVGRIAAHLPASAKDGLQRGLGELVDERSSLYLRFDKQRLIEGQLEEGTGDPVRIKVKPRGYLLQGDARELYSRILFGDG